MKILLINDYLISGGAEIYTLNLKEILELEKHDVYLMTFDKNYKENIKKLENRRNIYNMVNRTFLHKMNKLIFNPVLYIRIRNRIKQIRPDKIIVNNTFFSPITQIVALKDYEVFQVVHDYSMICPKSTCIKSNFQICQGYKKNNCAKECLYHDSKIFMYFKLKLIKRMEKIRKKIIKEFISPSECLNNYLKEYEYNSKCINNPIKTENVNICKQKDANQYIFVGALNENKGIFKFLDVFAKFSENKKVYIEVYGKATEAKYESLINKYDNKKIKFMGTIPNSQIFEKISKSKYMIVPSLWMENYPTTVLEGMISNTVIIGSNRGGVGELLDKNKGITFDILDDEDILKKLEKSYLLTSEEYNKIAENAFEFVKNNNSFERYSKKIIETIGEKN